MTDEAARQARRMTIFRSADAEPVAPEMMPREGIDDGVMAGFKILATAGAAEGVGEQTRVLFREPGENGMSLVYAWFKSGYVLPFHSHDTDCLYYIIGGELRMGSHVLRKGDGMFIPGDRAYGYEAGPEGVEVLEFRNATRFNLRYGRNDERRWRLIADAFSQRSDIWAGETVPPSDRGQ